jgi:hypothetical protein
VTPLPVASGDGPLGSPTSACPSLPAIADRTVADHRRRFEAQTETTAMARSITGTIGLAATLAFALPAALLGVEFLLGGRTLYGAALLFVAALMVAVEEYVTSPTDVPAAAAEKVVGRVATESEESESTTHE